MAGNGRADQGNRAAEVHRGVPARSISPTLAAHMAGTFQELSRGRLLLNVVTGGHSDELRRFGDFTPKDERYARCDEFLSVVRGAWGTKPFDFTGTYYTVEGATVFSRPDPLPVIYFGGSSPAAVQVAARQADVYLTFGEPPAQVREKIDWVRGLAAQQGRQLRFGMRIHVITRDRGEQAWAEAARLVECADDDEIATAQQTLAVSESVGQRRQQALLEDFRRSGDPRDLEIYPNLWAGIGLLRGGAGTAWSAATIRSPTGSRSMPPWDRGIHPVRVSAPGGGVLVRRGRAAHPGPPRPLAAPRARPGTRRRPARRSPRPHARSAV